MVEVLFVDNHLLLLNKPAGLLTEPNDTEAPSLEALGKSWLKRRFQKPGNVFLTATHRLDRPVSGMVLFARTSKALARLNCAHRQSLFKKDYLAIVEGSMKDKEGLLEHYLQKQSYFTQVVPKESSGSKKCWLKYSVVKSLNRYTLLKISLMTGRYHQIRAQLAAIGRPILGDRKYGSTTYSEQLFLHHFNLTFPHPITHERLHYEIPLPDTWAPLLRNFPA